MAEESTKAPREKKDHGGVAEGGVRGFAARMIVCTCLLLGRYLPMSWVYTGFTSLAALQRIVSPAARKIVEDNLRQALGDIPPEEMKRRVRENFRYVWGLRHADLMMIHRFTPKFCKENVEFKGLENYTKAVDEGKGVLLVGFHHGSPAVIYAAAIPHLGYRMVGAARRIFDPYTSKHLKARIEYWGGEMHYSDFAYPDLVKCLEAGDTSVTVADHMTSPRGLRINYFGRDTLMPAGPAIMAYRHRPSLVPCYCVRTAEHKFLIVFGNVIEIPPTPEKITEEDLAAITQQYLPFFEDIIRKYPEQWETFFPNWPKSFSEEDVYEFYTTFGVVT